MKTYEIAKKLLIELEELGIEAYLVGGVVRDYLLNNDTNDIDLSAKHEFNEMKLILGKKYTLDESASDFYCLKFNFMKKNIQITSFRKDVEYYDKRHAIVESTSEIKIDSNRRDFTINAMYLDKDFKLYDFHNSKEDLQNKIIRTIKECKVSFNEDPLRALRAIKYASRYGFSFAKDIEDTFEKVDLSIIKNKVKQELDEILLNEKKYLNYLKEFAFFNDFKIAIDMIITNDLNRTEMYTLLNYFQTLDLNYKKSERKSILVVLKLLKNKDLYEIYKNINYFESFFKLNKLLFCESFKKPIISSRKDLRITSEELINFVNKKNINEIYKKIEIAVLQEKIENNKEVILDFVRGIYDENSNQSSS